MSRMNYNKFSNQKHDHKQDIAAQNFLKKLGKIVENEVVVEEKLEETIEQKVEFVTGVVDHCAMLNVRAEPSMDAEVLRKISVNTKVMIDPFETSGDFYKVYLADGSEGFCMKKFIEIE